MEETKTAAEKIIPISPAQNSGTVSETGKVQPSQSYKEVVTGTDAPGKQVKETEIAPVPTVPATSPASETTAEEIKIVPLS